MDAETLLRQIIDFCRRQGMAETTFGRLAVNDGKFVRRLRLGGRITLATAQRTRKFMHEEAIKAGVLGGSAAEDLKGYDSRLTSEVGAVAMPDIAPEKNFRFYDNRQKYLMFVNTTSEKQVVAARAAAEFANVNPRPPGLRVFDAGVGDGTVLARLMRNMHQRFERVPFYIVGKEISLEDARLALEKMPDRFFEHPATVFVLTNMKYSEAPWLTPGGVGGLERMVWHEVALRGGASADFDHQIAALTPFLAEHWQASVSKSSGNPVYKTPTALVLYREDFKFSLDQLIPRRDAPKADFDFILASQPYRARAPIDFKVKKVLAPLARALGPGGRLLGINSCGGDPGLEIIQRVWPGEQPFTVSRHDLLQASKEELGRLGANFSFIANADSRSIFRYDMHTLPNEIELGQHSIGTSTLLAAWNAAVYVAQIEDQRLEVAMRNDSYLQATREVLKERGGLWFFDETFTIIKKREGS